jgi:hypothetical protein
METEMEEKFEKKNLPKFLYIPGSVRSDSLSVEVDITKPYSFIQSLLF